jgi:dienelactone hydrolase
MAARRRALPRGMASSTASAPVTPVLSISPVVLPAPGRPVDLEVRVSAPVTGGALPVVLLSHGHGPSHHLSSLDGYAPIAGHLAAHGFVVVQPTHLDSKRLPFRASDHPDAPLFWRSRADDMARILDQLDAIERSLPGLAGRVDRTKVAVVGHSMGGHTASLLLGARHRDGDGREVRLADPRIEAGVLLAAPGRGDALSAYAAEHYPFFATIDFSTMTTPALVIAGDDDPSPHLTGLARRSVRAGARPQGPGHAVRCRPRPGRHLRPRRRRDHRREPRPRGRRTAPDHRLPAQRASPRRPGLGSGAGRADQRRGAPGPRRVEVTARHAQRSVLFRYGDCHG